ncbi:high affinity cAMP-specific and IBMX-insensitive 3',5'-cyclic phosphodiesterase 8B-like [Lampetra planeri]
MGCAPSIHVSQSGVIYCRDSDDSTSPRQTASVSGGVPAGSGGGPHGLLLKTDAALSLAVQAEGAGTVLACRSRALASTRRPRREPCALNHSTEAETQTSRSSIKHVLRQALDLDSVCPDPSPWALIPPHGP